MTAAVNDLRVKLLGMNNTSYNAIDEVMKKIAKEYNITTTKLHKDFVKKYKMIPDDWIKKVNLEEGFHNDSKPKTFGEFVAKASRK